jgi:hypothetical protein
VASSAAGTKWAEGPAPEDQRDTPLALSFSGGLDCGARTAPCFQLSKVDLLVGWALGLEDSLVRRRSADNEMDHLLDESC